MEHTRLGVEGKELVVMEKGVSVTVEVFFFSLFAYTTVSVCPGLKMDMHVPHLTT